MSRRPPSRDVPPLTFFLDECVAIDALADALRPLVHVELFTSHFARGVADAEWLPVVGERGWVVLTRDVYIRWRPHELEALERARVAMFVLRGKELRRDDIVAAFAGAMPRMVKAATTRRPPFVCAVHASDRRLEFKHGGNRRGGRR